jgi:hypothetical protein
MSETFAPITKFEDLPERIIKLIYAHAHWIIFGKIDQQFGAGQIDPYTKAVWTTDGKRITVFLKDAFIISQSKEVDPLYKERKEKLTSEKIPSGESKKGESSRAVPAETREVTVVPPTLPPRLEQNFSKKERN